MSLHDTFSRHNLFLPIIIRQPDSKKWIGDAVMAEIIKCLLPEPRICSLRPQSLKWWTGRLKHCRSYDKAKAKQTGLGCIHLKLVFVCTTDLCYYVAYLLEWREFYSAKSVGQRDILKLTSPSNAVSIFTLFWEIRVQQCRSMCRGSPVCQVTSFLKNEQHKACWTCSCCAIPSAWGEHMSECLHLHNQFLLLNPGLFHTLVGWVYGNTRQNIPNNPVWSILLDSKLIPNNPMGMPDRTF
jgi:hypothetical protein